MSARIQTLNARTILPFITCGCLVLAGCQKPGADLEANVYDASQVNKPQIAKVVHIMSVSPATIEVSNKQAQQMAEVGGGILGAVGGGVLGNKLSKNNLGGTAVGGIAGGAAGAGIGSLVPGKTPVEGVTLTYTIAGELGDRISSSTQVGRQCEFKPGNSMMVMTSDNDTRIQPNDTCPPPPQ